MDACGIGGRDRLAMLAGAVVEIIRGDEDKRLHASKGSRIGTRVVEGAGLDGDIRGFPGVARQSDRGCAPRLSAAMARRPSWRWRR